MIDFRNFIDGVMVLCAKYRGSVSSWGRTPKHNKEVGGVEGSYHLIWLGCDVVLDEMKKNPGFEKDAEQLNIRAIMEGDHYHLQPWELPF
ncbi:MAG: hypothetical protein FJ110_05580 [Deltaproteobacteria bacterium]|nr:hypothetical protein [Deltaproteobacteria bacterium]